MGWGKIQLFPHLKPHESCSVSIYFMHINAYIILVRVLELTFEKEHRSDQTFTEVCSAYVCKTVGVGIC